MLSVHTRNFSKERNILKTGVSILYHREKQISIIHLGKKVYPCNKFKTLASKIKLRDRKTVVPCLLAGQPPPGPPLPLPLPTHTLLRHALGHPAHSSTLPFQPTPRVPTFLSSSHSPLRPTTSGIPGSAWSDSGSLLSRPSFSPLAPTTSHFCW